MYNKKYEIMRFYLHILFEMIIFNEANYQILEETKSKTVLFLFIKKVSDIIHYYKTYNK